LACGSYVKSRAGANWEKADRKQMDETHQTIERSKKECKTLHTFVQIAQPFLL
jgi:hypothetical protein